MQFDLQHIWQQMGVSALVVAGVLLLMGLASLTVVVERLMALRSSRRASARFARTVGDSLSAESIDVIIEHASEKRLEKGHLTRIVRQALMTYRHALATSDVGGLPPAERTRRDVLRFLEEIGTDLRRGLNVLSSVGSTAPFVGLLGTVVGIISAFQGIAATGSGGLASVSAGISEALIVTALGLAVAIPAVLAFNYFSGRIAREELGLNHAAAELLDTIDDWEERRVSGGSAAASLNGASQEDTLTDLDGVRQEDDLPEARSAALA